MTFDYEQRAKEILNEKYLVPMLHLIGKENGLSIETVNKDKKKKYFKEMIIEYISNEI